VKSQKCLYHVTFNLDLDLEHILDAGPSAWGPWCASLVALQLAICLAEAAICAKCLQYTDRRMMFVARLYRVKLQLSLSF